MCFSSRPCASTKATAQSKSSAVLDDELDLVPRAEELQVLEVVARLHARAGAFHVDDLEDARVDAVERDVPPRFDEHGVSQVAERGGERIEPLLLERLSSRELDERRAQALDLREDLVQPHGLPALERVRAVAPDAAQAAARQAHERAGEARERGLALKAAEDLGDDERRGAGQRHRADDSARPRRSAAIIAGS